MRKSNHMIRTSTLLLTGCFASCALAQPSFQFANFPTSPIAMTFYSLVDDGGTSAPSNGADQTWQFGAVTWAQAGTVVLGDAAGTLYAGDYPTANSSWIMTPTGGAAEYQYSLVDNTGFEIIATHVPAAPNVYSDHQKVMQFPWTFNTSFLDGFTSPDHSGTDVWTYDGYGTFITDLGTFSDQMKTTSSDGDLILWNEDPLYPTLIANSSSVLLLVPSVNGISEAAVADQARLYPNPCGTEITTENLPEGTWRITDVTGRTVLSGRSSGALQQRIDVAQLLAGSYTLRTDNTRTPLRFTKP